MVSSGHPRWSLLYRRAASLRGLQAPAVLGTLMEKRQSLPPLWVGSGLGDANRRVVLGPVCGFLEMVLFTFCFILFCWFISPLRLITSPSYFPLTYVLLAPFNVLPLHNSH